MKQSNHESHSPEELGTILLVEQLRRKGHTIESAQSLNTPEESTKWLQVIKWDSKEEAEDFRKWAIEQICKSTQYKGFSKKYRIRRAEEEFSWWDLDLGLSIKSE